MSQDKSKKRPAMTYRDAGVNIDAGNRLVSLIRRSVASTHRPEVRSDIGGFGALFAPDISNMTEPMLVSATDGVGTKLKLAFLMNRHDTVGIDLVAMSVNDLIVQGAEPLFFLDYFATGHLDPKHAAAVVEGIAEGCRQSGCALIGGETAEMPDFYDPGEYDLAGFAVGMVDRPNVIDGRRITAGDAIIGLASTGPHSNGYSLIRHLILGEDGPGLDAPFNDGTLGDALLAPTKIYVKSLLALAKQHDVRGLIHITGGGFWDNIPRILPQDARVTLHKSQWHRPEVFDLLQKLGNIEEHEMLRTFNCGIGMVVILPNTEADDALKLLNEAGETATLIGHVHSRDIGQESVTIED
ncbi:MAG: phosphoribosylformylglycinamidine cyclo-ligase [Magnetococcales bacterium]|nr:phosphoribosylformylglycinamidine cyclo-ligase [Magnetococcales bacterium]